MPAPFPARLDLTPQARAELEALTRRHTAGQQLVLRARIVLAAADGLNNSQIVRELGVALETVRLWRRRWLELAGVALADVSVRERLADAPRAGRPSRFTAEQLCRMVALACAAPATHGRPISQWTGREIAAELVGRGIVEAISGRHAARLLKRGTSGPTASGTG
jgi:putative transposase